MKNSNYDLTMRHGIGAWLPPIAMAIVLLSQLLIPNTAFAQSANACTPITGFLTTILAALKPISIGVVTIAFIFAGYQIAFNHKRVIDVAPILVGAIVIGAASQLAGWFLGGNTAGTLSC